MKNKIGYRIFFRYLDYIWNTEEHDWLGALLGGMSLLADGCPADPAYASDCDSGHRDRGNRPSVLADYGNYQDRPGSFCC